MEIVPRLGELERAVMETLWSTDAPVTARDVQEALAVHGRLITSRDWGLRHLDALAAQASLATGVAKPVCLDYLSGLDYRLSYGHLAGLTEFFRRLVAAGRVPDGSLRFLPAA